MTGGRGVSLWTCLLLIAASSAMPLEFGEPFGPILSVDLHFVPPELHADPSAPYVGDTVKLTSNLAYDMKQSWTKYGVVLDPGPGDCDSWELNSPSAMYDGGEYKMWYAGTAGVYPHGTICYATSADGITWTKYGTVLDYGPPGESENVHYPYVMKEGATYKMWYAGYDGSAYRIFHATSADGLSWTRHGLVLGLGPPGSYDDTFVFEPSVLLDSGAYKMWYSGFDGGAVRTMYATSPNGLNWTRKGVALDLGTPGSKDSSSVSGPWVFKEGSEYDMWYSGSDGTHSRILYATSMDSVTWTRRGVVVDVGPPGSTDGKHVYNPSVLDVPGKPYQMWYSGRNTDTQRDRIHHAYMTGGSPPTEANVYFYLDGTAMANKIGSSVAHFGNSTTATVSIDWVAKPRGPHIIYAVVDPLNNITETDETNNVASLNITVRNHPPVADAGGPYSSYEGSAVTFYASGSYDIDNDTLFYRWDFEGDGAWDTAWLTDATYYHVYGDDFSGSAVLEVYDGYDTATDTADVTILNILPSGTLSILSSVQHEGSSIQFSAHITDPGSDDLFLKWTWGYGAPDESSTYYNNGVGPDPYPSTDIHPRDITDVKSHTYGDNGAFTVTVFIRDDDSGSSGTTLTITATPDNLPPSVSVSGGMNIDEGRSVSLTATATDPGSDDLKFDWSWGEGSSDSKTYYNDGVGPDPPNSPGGTFPFTATDVRTHPYGDNGLYTVTLTVIDDDGGSTTWSGQVAVANLPPTVNSFGPFTGDEGSLLTLATSASDPGSDDLTFSWMFELGPTFDNIHYNNGVGPDPPQSPGGTYPFTASDSAEHTYGDNGVYVVTLTVTDDDGGSASYSTEVNVTNLPPSITPFGPFDVNEADPLTVATGATDPGSDDLTFTWAFEYGPTTQSVHYNDGIGPDPPKSPDGVFPFSTSDLASHIYGDNGVFKISLTVQDDDGGVATYETLVTVHNVAPVIDDFQAYVVANITLRVAGEKWHDVCMNLVHNGGVEGKACVTRYPGSPDEQSATITGRIQLLGDFRIVLYYTPMDDPINGQPNGANPAWVIVKLPGGDEVRFHHTFNVQHPDTWTWTLDDIRPYLVGQTITFNSTANDVGSDDLTFTWGWGDGTPSATTTHFNDGVGPDPYPSPEGTFPFTATDVTTHVFSIAGTYAVTLTVTDDDGGAATYSVTITIG